MQLELFPRYNYAKYKNIGESQLEQDILNSVEELWWEWHPNYPYTTYQSTFGLGVLGAIFPEDDKHIISFGIGKNKRSAPMTTEQLIATAIGLMVYTYGVKEGR